MAHRHNWQLAGHYNGHLIDVGDHAMSYKPPESRWLCHCGAQKVVTVSDLLNTDRDANTDAANAPKGNHD